MKDKKLFKSAKNRMICGVCGGFAEYFNMDPTIVRLILVIITLFKGAGLLLYIIAAFVIPQNDSDIEIDIENMKSANLDGESESKSKKSSKVRSDEDFDSYFKK